MSDVRDCALSFRSAAAQRAVVCGGRLRSGFEGAGVVTRALVTSFCVLAKLARGLGKSLVARKSKLELLKSKKMNIEYVSWYKENQYKRNYLLLE